MLSFLILVHYTMCAMLSGLIWFVQIVHYPLFLKVPEEQRPAYCQAHTYYTSWVVVPLMVTELTTAVVITFLLPKLFWIVNLLLLLSIWASTFLRQVKQHNQLCVDGDIKVAAELVRSNWTRTFLWNVRLVFLTIYFAKFLMV